MTPSLLLSVPLSDWDEAATLPPDQLTHINEALEDGRVIFLPPLAFRLHPNEQHLLSPLSGNGKAKNISFFLTDNNLRGATEDNATRLQLRKLMQRYAVQTSTFMKTLFPHYAKSLILGRTSFRPVEAEGRPSPSYKKDDTRLHVDAFPASPTQGRRILRVFTNINALQKPRCWRLGEPFAKVAETFLPTLKLPAPGSRYLLNVFKITKSLRTEYDHFMLQIHDNMKKDSVYQQDLINTGKATEFAFPANSTWIVYTDQTSHAALSGQHLLEQTFYLPHKAMLNPEKSPLKILEQLTGRALS